jgi:hypothetical protein
MRTPPLLLGGALLLWAWQTGLWWIALPLALALEGSRFSSIRWNFDQTDLNRLWNLCVVAFAGCTVYLLASAEDGLGLAAAVAGSRRNPASAERAGVAFRNLTQWFPLCTAPMILAAAWGRLETLPVSTFSWYLQKRRPDITTTIRIDWTYLILVVAGASAGDTSPGFVPVLVAYFGWLLWTRRNPGYRPVWFAVGFSLAAAAALFGHRPLQPAAAWWRDMESRMLSRLFQRDTNPSESRTSIGRIGVGKGSGAVAFRIESDPTNPPVELLRDAIYSSYRRTVWQNPTGADFGDLTPSTLEGAFVVGPETNGLASLRLWLQPGRRRLLPTPPGLQVIDPIPADLLQKSQPPPTPPRLRAESARPADSAAWVVQWSPPQESRKLSKSSRPASAVRVASKKNTVACSPASTVPAKQVTLSVKPKVSVASASTMTAPVPPPVMVSPSRSLSSSPSLGLSSSPLSSNGSYSFSTGGGSTSRTYAFAPPVPFLLLRKPNN